jgi:hypothetical protein
MAGSVFTEEWWLKRIKTYFYGYEDNDFLLQGNAARKVGIGLKYLIL